MATIRNVLSNYPFVFHYDWCGVIPHREESTFDWITGQQSLLIERAYGDSLGFFSSVSDGTSELSYSPDQSIGIIDIGGASVEIAFEVDPSKRIHVNDLHHDELFQLNENTFFLDDDSDGILSIRHSDLIYQVYVRGFEQIGHKQFQILYQKLLYEEYVIQEQLDAIILDDPCGIKDALLAGRFNGPYEKPIYLLGSADAERCMDVMREAFKLDQASKMPCDVDDNEFCSFGGKSQPKPQGKLFFGISQFRGVNNYFNLGDSPKLSDLVDVGKQILEMNYYYALDLYDEPLYYDFYTQYFELFYLYILLTEG